MFDLLAELRWRNLLKDCTDEAGMREHLAHPETARRTVYCGFDPTAPSLTIGNLVPMMMLRHFRDAGHRVIVVQGGATGRIGDPSGKEAERAMRTEEEVQRNLDAQTAIFRNVLGADVMIVDNYSWWKSMSFLGTLRDVGKFFSVNQMVKRDSVAARLEREQGISYTEFSYMLLQAYDFLHLFEHESCSVQMAGADQWGNIVSGVDLIRRRCSSDAEAEHREASDSRAEHPSLRPAGSGSASDPHAFGLVAPLLLKSDGTKFGKTESGAVWLSDPGIEGFAGTSAYAFSQFWLNADDADVPRFLRTFTLLPHPEIEELERVTREHPERREGQKRLAEEVTSLVHGRSAMERAQAAGRALFSGEVRGLDAATLRELFAAAPSSDHPIGQLAGDGVALVDLLTQTSLAASKREAREFLGNGAVTVNGEKAGPESRVTKDVLLEGAVILLRRGKKNWHVTRWK